MRDLKEMEEHRRLKGVGRSKPGDISGTFDVPLRHNRFMPERTAVCKVTIIQGWQILEVAIKFRTGKRLFERAPHPSETSRLLPLFFREWEAPVQFHTMQDHVGKPVSFCLSERVNECLRHLPPF